jgi:hypothetical protein
MTATVHAITAEAVPDTCPEPFTCPEGHGVNVSEGMFCRYIATCDCYDGADDAGWQLIGHGETPTEALDAFVERWEEREEVWWWPNDLAFQVRAERRHQAGWRLIDGVYGPSNA